MNAAKHLNNFFFFYPFISLTAAQLRCPQTEARMERFANPFQRFKFFKGFLVLFLLMTGSVKAGLSSSQSLLAASSHHRRRDSVAPEGNTEMCAWNHPRARARQRERERGRDRLRTHLHLTHASLCHRHAHKRASWEKSEGGRKRRHMSDRIQQGNVLDSAAHAPAVPH